MTKEDDSSHLAHGCDIGSCSNITESKGQIAARELPLAKESLTIAPNPVTNTARISFTLDKPSSYKVEIYNITGVRLGILESGVSSGQIQFVFDAAGYTPGVYLVKLITDTEVTTKQIIVQR